MSKTKKTVKTGKIYFSDRKSVPKEHSWRLEKMYSSQAAWEKHFAEITKKVPSISKYRGQLKSPTLVMEYFQKSSALMRQIEKLYVYASHLSSVDLANHHAQILTQKAQDLYVQFSQAVSFQGPELVKLPDTTLKKMIGDKKFHPYHRELKLILHKKKHILSDAEEGLMSLFGKITTGPEDIFSALNDVDITFADVEDEQGRPQKLTAGNFQNFLENSHRPIRQRAFENHYRSYQAHIHTYAQTLNLVVKQHHLFSSARKYQSCLESSLSGNMIDPKVYETLIKETHTSLPVLHKYLDLRRRKLGLKKLAMWDLRVNWLQEKPLQYTFEEAVELCLQAVAPLGEEYVKIMEAGLRGGWIDKYENKGKRGGAFSGGCYDSDPYILMNFTGTLNDVYTLIHEAGHSMHSWLARHNQPYSLADYALFTAEIASTVNERLLMAHLLKIYSGLKQKIVLAYEIDAIRATYFRQTMFAEFELNIHCQIEQGKPLTSQYFNEEYARLNTLYYGKQVASDPYIQYEWARIPHFYYNFYVYQYATGIAAAYHFTDLILHPKTGHIAASHYLDFLKSGGNDFPLEQLKQAGLDFTKPKLYQAVAKNLQKCLNLL